MAERASEGEDGEGQDGTDVEEWWDWRTGDERSNVPPLGRPLCLGVLMRSASPSQPMCSIIIDDTMEVLVMRFHCRTRKGHAKRNWSKRAEWKMSLASSW